MKTVFVVVRNGEHLAEYKTEEEAAKRIEVEVEEDRTMIAVGWIESCGQYHIYRRMVR